VTGPERRLRSTTGDLLHLVEELSSFDRIGVTRLALLVMAAGR
jgi:hypothetical protein